MARKRQRDWLCARVKHNSETSSYDITRKSRKKNIYIHMRHCCFLSLTRTLTWRRVFIKRLQKWIVFVTRFWVSISRYECVWSAHLFLESFLFYVCCFVFIRSSVAIVIHSYCIFVLFPSTLQVKRKHTETKRKRARERAHKSRKKKKWQKQKWQNVCANIVCASMTYALAMPNRFSVERKTKKSTCEP